MIPKSALVLKSVLSVVIGGAAGAAVEFFANAQGKESHIDWHQLGINAGIGALVALCHYIAPSPVGKP